MNKRIRNKIAKRHAHDDDGEATGSQPNGQHGAEGGIATPVAALREAVRKFESSAAYFVRVVIGEVKRSAAEALQGATAAFEQIKDKIAPARERSVASR
jgi:hypothetical protein